MSVVFRYFRYFYAKLPNSPQTHTTIKLSPTNTHDKITDNLHVNQEYVYNCGRGVAQKNIDMELFNCLKIPLPPLRIQQKIVDEIEEVEKNIQFISSTIDAIKNNINTCLASSSKVTSYNLGQILSLEYGKALPKQMRINGEYPVVGSNGIDGYHNDFLLQGPNIIVGRKGSVGKVNWINENCNPIDTCYYVKNNSKIIDLKYCYYLLKISNLEALNVGMGPGGLNRNTAYSLKVKIPILSEQQKIVSQIEELEKQIDEAQKVIDNSKLEKQKIIDKYLK